MKKKITALLVGIFALVITTHAQAPVVTFTATPATVCDSGYVTFTNTATNFPTEWRWYFPGGSPSTYTTTVSPGNPPPIRYNYTGTYYVTCVAEDGNPVPNTDSVTTQSCVTVLPDPQAKVSPPYAGICNPPNDTVYFKLIDTSHTFNTYSWAPNTSLSCSNCSNPHAYPTIPTVYTITVTSIDGCSITLYDTVTVGAITARITGRDTICAGLSDTLTASGGSSSPPGSTYRWSNGATTSSIIITPTTTTNYSVTIVSGSGGCVGSDPMFTVVVAPKPTFTLTFDPADSICKGENVAIKVSSSNHYEYIWDGPNAAPDTTNDFGASPIITTTYTLAVLEHWGCRFDSLVKIKVNNPPIVHFTGATDLCQGSSTTISAIAPLGERWMWSTGQTTSSINVTGIVSLTYTVQVSDGFCFKDTSFSIVVDTPPKNFFIVKPDTSICLGDSVTIFASINNRLTHEGYEYTYLWNTGSTTDSVHTGKLFLGQTYYLTVTHGACSLDSAEVTIKVYPLPNPSAWPLSTTICQWDSVKLSATGGDYYTWKPDPEGLGHYLRYIDTDRNEASPPVTTVYTVNVCTWGCCKDTTITVNVTPGVLGFNVCCNTSVPSGTPVNLSATFDPGPYQVEGWSPATGLSCTNCANPTATVDSTTKYVVTFIDLVTGCTVNDSVTIDIFNCNVFVPNAFSPNGDGVNDYLYVRSLCMKTMQFAVFDRFGNKVFETTTQDHPWDGTYKGKKMDIGTYMWYLTGLLNDGTHISKSGNVTLVR